MTRIYQPVPLAAHSTLQLDEKASHHLARVLRANVGEAVILFNGQGGEYHATISAINKKTVQVTIHQFVKREAESSLSIHLAQGISRGEKMDFVIQKAVELGVKKITPLITERCTVKLDNDRSEKRQQHWQAIAVSACEQCGRNQIPEIAPTQSLASWLATVKDQNNFVLSPHVTDRLPDHLPEKNAEVILLIGPEGGLSENEIQLSYKQNFMPLSLGPRVLRTETAPLVALTILQHQFGDL